MMKQINMIKQQKIWNKILKQKNNNLKMEFKLNNLLKINYKSPDKNHQEEIKTNNSQNKLVKKKRSTMNKLFKKKKLKKKKFKINKNIKKMYKKKRVK